MSDELTEELIESEARLRYQGDLDDERPRVALEAVRKARGDLTGAEVVQTILATHPPGCTCGKHEEGDGDGES